MNFYLDNNATTPLLPEVWEAIQPFATDNFGNPSSAHAHGRQARRALEEAREKIAGLLDAHPDEVVFTSGATEANNLALFSLAGDPPGVLLTSPIEHPCVIGPLRQLEARGFALDWMNVDATGVVEVRAPKSDTKFGVLMLANHETGAVQPVASLVEELGAIPVHCDAAQAVGKLPVKFHELCVASLSLSAHKFHGPRGIGALLVSRCARLRPLFWGGHQQHGRRPGTEPVALAVGMAVALELACRDSEARLRHVARLRERFLVLLHAEAAPMVLNGPQTGGVPHTLNLSFPGVQADALLMALDLAGVSCSTGSACSSGSLLPSPVLQAMQVPDEVLRSAMRFSFSFLLSLADVEEAARRIGATVARLRALKEETQVL